MYYYLPRQLNMNCDLSTNYRATNIVIIDSIPRNWGELQTAFRLEENLRGLVESNGDVRAFRYQINSKIELIQLFEKLQLRCQREGLKPSLHIEGHGSNDGLTLGNNQEFISWLALKPYFEKLNEASKNNLGLFLATCGGYSFCNHLELDNGSPFNFLIAPKQIVLPGSLNDSMTKFTVLCLKRRTVSRRVSETVSESPERTNRSSQFRQIY